MAEQEQEQQMDQTGTPTDADSEIAKQGVDAPMKEADLAVPLSAVVPNFKDIMGFAAAGSDVLYEDDVNDGSIPDIQKITKRNNILPHWGNVKTMNMNTLVLENVLISSYFKNYLEEVTTFQQLTDEIYYSVHHLEPWERGTRRTIGMTGMCGGVRGVGAGGIPSTAFCLLYKMFTMRTTRKQLVAMLNSRQSIYVRGVAFLFVRYTQPPTDLWSWLEPYLDDEEQIDPKSGGGDLMSIGQLVRMMLTKLDFYGTLFPRIPVPIQKDIEEKFRQRRRAVEIQGNEEAAAERRSRSPQSRRRRSRSPAGRQHSPSASRRRSRSRDERDRKRYHDKDERSQRDATSSLRQPTAEGKEVAGAALPGRRKFRCDHHLRHHHCRKHRNHCPSVAKMKRQVLEKEKRESEHAPAMDCGDGPNRVEQKEDSRAKLTA